MLCQLAVWSYQMVVEFESCKCLLYSPQMLVPSSVSKGTLIQRGLIFPVNPLGVFLEFDDHTPYRPSELDVYGLSCFVTVAAENRLLSESPPVELMGIFALDLS